MNEPREDLPFTPAARRLWPHIPEPIQRQLLDYVAAGKGKPGRIQQGAAT